MLVNVELFSQTYQADIEINDGFFKMELLPNAKEELEEYLRLVLPYYIPHLEKIDEFTLEELVNLAVQWEKANPDDKLVEPKVAVRFNYPLDSYNKLIEMSKSTGIPYAHIVAGLVEKNFSTISQKK